MIRNIKSILEKTNRIILKILCEIRLNYQQDINVSNIKNSLLICYMGIGNLIQFLPVIREINNSINFDLLTIVVNNQVLKEIIESNINNPKIEITTLDLRKEKIIDKIRIFREFRKQKYDLFISNFLGVNTEHVQLALFCKIPHRIAQISSDIGGRGKYDFFPNYPVSMKNKHEMNFNLDLLSPLKLNKTVPKIEFIIKPEYFTSLSKYFKKEHNKKQIVMQVYSSNDPFRNWPRENYVELAKKLFDQLDCQIFLVGNLQERDEIRKIFDNVKIGYVNLAGKLNLFETAVLIRSVDFFVGNDSGLGHISASLGQNTLIIAGRTDIDRTRPIGKNVSIVKSDIECSPCRKFKDNKIPDCGEICLKSIDIGRVYKKIMEIMWII